MEGQGNFLRLLIHERIKAPTLFQQQCFEALQDEVNLRKVSKECSNGVPPKGGECPLMVNEQHCVVRSLLLNEQQCGEHSSMVNVKNSSEGTSLSTRRLEGSDKSLFQEAQLTKTISWESSQVFQPLTFQAPSLSEKTLNGKANRKTKKRSFKARGDHARLDSDFNQMIILNYRILEVSDVSSLNAQYGKVNFPLAFTKQFQDQGVLEPAPIRVPMVWKSDAVGGMSKLLLR